MTETINRDQVMAKKVAVVTGSNRGIGYAVIEGLLRSDSFNGDLVLCCRNLTDGNNAAAKLKTQVQTEKVIHVQQVSIQDKDSVSRLREFLVQNFGGLDILVNNAAIVYVDETVKPLDVIAKETIDTNYYGTANVCHEMFGILKPGARVVNVSSITGMINWIDNREIKRKLMSPQLSETDLNNIVEEYLSDVKHGKLEEKGWPTGIMSVAKASKIFVTALTNILARESAASHPSMDIVINCAHPGFVKTEMSGGRGFVDPSQGAAPILMGCLVPPNGEPNAKFIWDDCSLVPWDMDREKIQAIMDSYPSE